MVAPRPLEGLLVVSVEQAVAAPLCTARLGDAGARVIKVERPEGDFARGYDRLVDGESAYFVWLNRGKESLVLDLRQSGDLDFLDRLIGRADILVQNLKPGSLNRLGIDPDAIRKRNPGLIVCNISGFRGDGDMADRKAYDLLIQAESGLCSITGSPQEPGRVGISIVDIATGTTAYEAILEALIARGKNGEGLTIDISMFDVIAELSAVPWLQWRYGGKEPARVGLNHPTIQPYGAFPTGSGVPILIAIQNEREWQRLCAHVLGNAELASDPRFNDNTARVANLVALREIIGTVFGKSDADTLGERLNEAGIAWGRVNGMEGLDSHPEFARAACRTPSGEAMVPLPAARFRGEARKPARVPALGEHTESIRAEFDAQSTRRSQ
ncbi:CaiB/BaiF CoA transferase family protein [Tepidamorphus sp. 3E244]|uniref:CaiB/BaiF CoA transferase family protein n=1 Tax=Tepidamorphus sp. 3E244 TaxID=3385498 RepID=UPI0038FCD35D